MKHPRIAFIGDLTVDRYVDKNEEKLGGAALNGAIWARRQGAISSVVTAVGNDSVVEKFLETFKKERIDASGLSILPGRTSSIEITIDSRGEKQYGKWDPGTLASYHLRKKDIRFLKTCDAVVVTVYPQFLHVLGELRQTKSMRRKGPLIIVNYGDLHEFEDSLEVPQAYIDVADILVFGLDKDLNEKHINTLRDIARASHKTVIVTLGAYGSLVYVADTVFVQQAKEARVVDTTGAGDAFLAAYIVKYLQTSDIAMSLQEATSIASGVIGHVGAH